MSDAAPTQPVEKVPYDELGLFGENIAEFGLDVTELPVVTRTRVPMSDGRGMSALVWDRGEPELVLVHGGAQNAHTWDTVALALGRPLIAVDLPGHGHSDGPAETGGAQISARANAADLAEVIRVLAPSARCVVGMSLGGLTSIALTGAAPELVRSLVLVDITPGVTSDKAKAITNFVNGPTSFPSFDEILARTVEHNPGRSVASLRRGILHNALQLDDGSWVWRHRRHAEGSPMTGQLSTEERAAEMASLWDVVGASTVPLMLVRGMRPQSVVDDGDEAELRRRRSDARIEHVVEAGHSVQGDTPVELARLIADFVDAAGPTDAAAHTAASASPVR